MDGTIIMMTTVQLMSNEQQKDINAAYNAGKVEAKQTESDVKYLLWK